jgi:drug/metabolite transporter (DMT)-like permease
LSTPSLPVPASLQRVHKLALVETAIAISFWGLSFVLIKIAVQEISPVTLIILRFSTGALILFVTSGLQGGFAKLRLGDLPAMATLGLVGVSLQQMLQVSGQVGADAGVAAFLASTAPAFMVLFGVLFLRERMGPCQVVGVLVATCGAALVSSGGDLGSLLRGRFDQPGNLLVLLSAVMWASFSVLNRYIVRDRPPTLITAGMMAFGTLFVLPVFIAQSGWKEISSVSAPVWVAVLLLGVFCTAIAYMLYAHALTLAPASRLAAIQTIEPLIAVVVAALTLGEVLTPALATGGAAILLGIYLVERNVSEGGQLPLGFPGSDLSP